MYQHTKITLILAAAIHAGIAQNPYTVSPANYRLEFENDWVRVSRASFVPGDKLPVHDHPAGPTVFVYLTDGGPIRFTHIHPEFTVERPAVKKGGVRFHTGAKETHVVEYLGDAPSEYLRIELKTDRPEKKTQHIRMPPEDPKSFENGQLRISRSECSSHQGCAPLQYPAVIVKVDDRSVSWHEMGHSTKNDSDQTSHQIRIELKTKPVAATE